MKIINLTRKSRVYTSNVYLVLGTWNTLEDLNTLVDVGRDKTLIEKINNAPTGVGKQKIDQVVLTHTHYDHAELLPLIRKIFKPKVYAFSPYFNGVDHVLKDGDTLMLGDRTFEVIYTPGHSNDSICLYCEDDGVVFAGDTTFPDGLSDEYPLAVRKICRRYISVIYYGHGSPQFNFKYLKKKISYVK